MCLTSVAICIDIRHYYLEDELRISKNYRSLHYISIRYYSKFRRDCSHTLLALIRPALGGQIDFETLALRPG